MRRIFIPLKISIDLERIADFIADICKIIANNDFTEFIKEAEDIRRMEKEVKNMVHLSIEAYLERGTKSAYDIYKLDDIINEIYMKVFKST